MVNWLTKANSKPIRKYEFKCFLQLSPKIQEGNTQLKQFL